MTETVSQAEAGDEEVRARKCKLGAQGPSSTNNTALRSRDRKS